MIKQPARSMQVRHEQVIETCAWEVEPKDMESARNATMSVYIIALCNTYSSSRHLKAVEAQAEWCLRSKAEECGLSAS